MPMCNRPTSSKELNSISHERLPKHSGGFNYILGNVMIMGEERD